MQSALTFATDFVKNARQRTQIEKMGGEQTHGVAGGATGQSTWSAQLIAVREAIQPQ